MWLVSGTITRFFVPARARSASWLASEPDGKNTAVSLPSSLAVLLERFDFSAEEIVVVLHFPGLAQVVQQRRVFTRRDADAVARRVNHTIGLNRGVGEDGRVRKAAEARSGAKRANEPASRDGIHESSTT